ncbi:hypothetical protein ACHWQZ_G014041 [Mnemiopsis leidyi]
MVTMDDCTKCLQSFSKVILILINTLALIAGIALIVVGGWALAVGKEKLPDLGVPITPAGTCLVVLGVLLMLVGCFGCFGAITGRHQLINIYLMVLGVIIILEIAVIIFVFVNKAKVSTSIKAAISDPFDDFNKDGLDASESDKNFVNTVQVVAKCCGIKGPAFWTNAGFAGQVPASCCESASEDDELCAASDAYNDGCLQNSEELVKKALIAMIVAVAVLVVFEIICMILAWCTRVGADYEQQK